MQSEKVWNTVEFGWSPPMVLDREGRPTNVIKPKLEWDRSENNARAMYSIFNAISTDEFRRGLLHVLQLRRLGISSK